MDESKLSREYLNEILQYRDGKLFWKQRLALCLRVGDPAGHPHDKNGYMRIQLHRKQFMVHRIIFAMHHGYYPSVVDHIDGNNTNNKIENLRAATQLQNTFNTKRRTTNTSGYKNVCWCKSMKKWQVSLRLNNKPAYFGWFEDIELADLVAQEARDKHHKQFARHS